jgi:hypothetical protein
LFPNQRDNPAKPTTKKTPQFMKKNNHPRLTARVVLGTLLLLAGFALICVIPLSSLVAGDKANAKSPGKKSSPAAVVPSTGPNPASGSISPSSTAAVTWVGTTVSPGGNTDESTCMDNSSVLGCETYTLTVNGSVADWAGKSIQVLLTWTNSANEYDIYVHKGTSNNGPLVTSAIQGPGLTSQAVTINPSCAGVGSFTIHVAYDTTPASAADEYHGAISVQAAATGGGGTAPPAPLDPGPSIGYEIFEAPGQLVQGTSTSSGALTVEYMGRNAGEPSVGANFKTGVINFQSDLETLFVTFDDSCNLANPKAVWVNRRAPTQQFIDSDPIGFTDRQTGRVFTGSLTLLSPDTPKVSYTDDDGLNWQPAPFMQGLASAVDHESIGGGPYHAPIPQGLPSPLYPNAVYYCSQDIAASFCARSDAGGASLGAEVPIYTLAQCGGLHGHVKVAPDGTAYVPNRSCGGNTAVVVSTDNGMSWTVRPISNATVPATPSGGDDPAVGLDASGRVYCAFSYNGTTPAVAVSTDQGQTWPIIYDLGASLGITNIAFPAAVGGDNGRAAVAFYGSTITCDGSVDTFPGVWHLYVAHTFDAGQHWTISDVTPSLPMQRMGLLRGGGGPVDRNLLDFFDITMDRDGRVIVGYVDGCSGGPCSQAASTATGNAYTTTAAIARQSSGRRLLAVNDPSSATSVPGIPYVTAKRIGTTVTLAWNQSDTGNLQITEYDIYRGTTSGGEAGTPLATIGNTSTYIDNSATDVSKTYYYRVVAKNSAGVSCANNEISVPYVGNTCDGIIIHRNLPSHPEATGMGATGVPSGSPTPTPAPTPALTAPLLIDYVAVAEPPDHPNSLKFQMKVGNLSTVPPNSRWRMVWDWVGTTNNPNIDEQYYVGMTTDGSSAVTFEYGTVATASLVVLGVPQENMIGTAEGSFNPDGTITIYVPRSAVGSPNVGDLLGAVNGRTFATGDTPPQTLERSTLLVDHTFVKGNTDNSFPPATYAIAGTPASCTNAIAPVSAVSRKAHGNAGTFDVDLPLTGAPGIECRTGAPSGNHTVVITFAAPVTSLTGATVTPGQGGTGSVVGTPTVNNTQVTVNLTNVSNAQTLTINLLGVTAGVNSGNVAIPMSVLLGDTTGNGAVNSSDISQTQSQSGQAVGFNNFREDVTVNGAINSSDISTVQSKSGTALP